VFNYAGCGTNLDHGVLNAGYGLDQDSEQPYWLVKNSWGPSWGESGYIRILRQSGTGPGICGIALGASYPTASSSPNPNKPHKGNEHQKEQEKEQEHEQAHEEESHTHEEE